MIDQLTITHHGAIDGVTGSCHRLTLPGGDAVLNKLAREFGLAFKGRSCQVLHEGMKLQIGDGTVLYPDLFVTCDKSDLAADQVFRAPRLVLNVLSPSNQGYDRVESFRRTADDQWVLCVMSEANTLYTASLNTRVHMAEVFAGI